MIVFRGSPFAVFSTLLLVLIFNFAPHPIAVQAQPSDNVIRRTTAEITALNEQRQPHIRIKREFGNEARRFIKSASGAPAVAALGEVSPLSISRAPQTLGTEFTGATLSDTSAFPPDSMGAVGPTQYLVGINGRIRVFDKNTGTVGALNVGMDSFFSAVMVDPINGFTSDPRVRYDSFTQKWIIIIIDIPPDFVDNRVLIAVSDGPIIIGATTWSFYYFQQNLAPTTGNDGCLLDYPSLGLDVNALYIGGNMFCGVNLDYGGTSAWVVRKAFISSGSSNLVSPTAYVTAFRSLAPSSGAGIYTPQGVDNPDPTSTMGYFIGVDNAEFSKLVIHRVNNPGSAAPTLSSKIELTVPVTSSPVPVPHQGNTGGANGNLDAIDDRLFAAMIQNGRLWTAHNIAVDTTGVAINSGLNRRNAVRWYELENLGSVPSVRQVGTIFDNAASNPAFYWFPSVAVSGQGHAAFGFSVAGNALAVSAGTTGRLSSDALSTVRSPLIYETGTGNYNPPSDPGGSAGRRWGDYSYVSVDPCDDMTMWTIQEFNNASNSYGVRVVELNAPPPAVLPSGPITSLNAGLSSVNINLVGSASNGEGFYDTPSSIVDPCRQRLSVTVSNGITVNSVAYNNPTSITVNLSTVAATAGTATVTVMNPDGQQVSTSITVSEAPSPTETSTIDPDTTPTETATVDPEVTPAGTATSDPEVTPTETATSDPEVTPTATQQVEVELLVNGGFEAKTEDNPDLTPWTAKNSTGDKIKCNKIDKIIAHEGSCAFLFKGGTAENSKISQNVVLDNFAFAADDTLSFSIYFNASSATVSGKVKVRVKYSDTTLDKEKITINLTQTTGYEEFPGTTTLKNGDLAVIKVQVSHKSLSGKVFIDALSMKRVSAEGLLPLP